MGQCIIRDCGCDYDLYKGKDRKKIEKYLIEVLLFITFIYSIL